MIVLDNEADVMKASAWRKITEAPVFQKTSSIWGVGHCSFVQSPCSTEHWIIYHAKSKRKRGWNDRHVHAQRFSWYNDQPVFGIPMPETKPARVVTEVIRPVPVARPSVSPALAPLTA
jgi:GH43 family beta-xylosidase